MSSPVVEDLVPLAERRRWLIAFRLAASVVVSVSAVVLPELQRVAGTSLPLGIVAYLLLACAGELIWTLSRRRGLPLFGMLLMLDGIFLAWAAYAIAEPSSPLRFLIVGHIVTVTLLASFRTGLKLSLWHSLLLLTVFHAQEVGLMGDPVALGDVEYRILIVSMVLYWAMAIATAAFAAVNERELRRRRYDLEALARLARSLEPAGDPVEVARHLVDAAADTFGFDRILLFASPKDELVLLHGHGITSGPAADASAGALLKGAASGHDPLLVARFAPGSDPLLAALLPECANLALVPLHAEGRSIGVLVCEHGLRRGSRIERRVVTMLERFASQASLALANAWLVEQLKRSASTDGLTGLANRRHFDSSLGREFARALRTGEPLSVVLADVDRFKQLNDRHGHQVGDAVLRSVAETLAGAARAGDVVARYGGEEFVVILARADGAVAQEAAERLRCAVEADSGEVPGVTISLGVATYPGDAGDPETLLRRADAALYVSKAEGRNRVTSAAGLKNPAPVSDYSDNPASQGTNP